MRIVLYGVSFLLALTGVARAEDSSARRPVTVTPGVLGAPRDAGAHTPSLRPGRGLVTLPDVSAQQQSLHVVPRALAPLAVHQEDWGVFNREGGTASGFGAVGRYGVARWAEDWSALADPALRRADNDPFDVLKFIPLNDSKSIYLTLSGEERLRNWFENRPFMGQQKPNDSGRMTLRSIYGADLHVGPHLRFYGEIINGAGFGSNAYGYNATYRKRLDLQQGFVELRGRVLGAKSGVMLGRMDYIGAPNYLLYLRETPNLPLSWNGARGYMVWKTTRLDLFDFVQTNTNPPPMFQDTPNWNARLYGAYVSHALPPFRFAGQEGHLFTDIFFVGYLLGGTPAAIASQGTTGRTTTLTSQSGSTRRDNIGTRLWGKAGPVELSLGGIYQGGEFRPATGAHARTVQAYAFNTSVGWRFAGLPARPLLGLQADLYSGGDDSNHTGVEHTYLAPYNPSSNYLDTTTYLASSNLIDVGPVIDMTPTTRTVLRIKVPVFWRANTEDAVYGSGRIYAFPKFSGGYIGLTPQATLAWSITRHLTWTQDLARFFASRSIQSAGASSGSYYLSTFTLRF